MPLGNRMLPLLIAVLVLLILWRLGRWGFLAALRVIDAPAIQAFGAWAGRHPLRAWLKQRFPRLYTVIAARLEPRRFSGLPVTLMAVAAAYAAALFGGLVEEVHEAAGIIAFDQAAGEFFQPWRQGALLRLFLWITTLGDSATLVAVALTATGLLWGAGQRSLLLPLWLTILGANATTWAGKFALDRARPDFVTAATALSPSFPSAHATGSAAVYGFIAYVVARQLRSAGARFDLAYATVVLVGLVGFSRVFLSVHFASDVAGGFLVGGFWLLVGFTLAEWRLRGRREP